MHDSLKKIILFAVGAASLTREKVEELVKDLEKEGALNEDEGRELVREVLSKSEQRTREVSEQVRTEVKRVLKEMGVKANAESTADEELESSCECHNGECNCDDDCDCTDCGCECVDKEED